MMIRKFLRVLKNNDNLNGYEYETKNLENRTFEPSNMEDIYNVFQIWFEREIKSR